MSAILTVGLVLICFFLGFRFYSRFLSKYVLKLGDTENSPPAVALRDNVDYVPTKKWVLFGHHYSSIAGAAPIVGPAVAVIWGWLPALLWVTVGTIFMGAAHDFGTLVISMRHKGRSIGEISGEILGGRVKVLFLTIIFFLVWMVIAVFALVIANLFVSFPSTVLPVNFQILVALAIGYFINRRGKNIFWPSVLAFGALMAMVVVGSYFPIDISGVFGKHTLMAWIVFLMVYSFGASVLPVWLLLQPRDYINSHQLFAGLGLLLLGLVVANPKIVAPAVNLSPPGAPPWLPFLFITIACGAISGFHGLVSSGTTSKQVEKWQDARPIGYGGMLGEGLLALLATMAVAAGFSSSAEWHSHYADWNSANGLSAKIGAFVIGSGSFLSSLGIPEVVSQTLVSVLIISFAATSLDTAVRIQRYLLNEVGQTTKATFFKNRYFSGFFAVGTAFLLMAIKGGGKGGLIFWPLFGATNQILAAVSLIVITAYLRKQKTTSLPFLIPAVFMVLITSISLVLNIGYYVENRDWMLVSLGLFLLIVMVFFLIETAKRWKT